MPLPRFLSRTCALVVLWTAVVFPAAAQAVQGLPSLHAPGALPVRTYDTSSHPGTADNWAVGFGADNRVFIGNGVGVFSIRGAHVSGLVPLDNRSVVRSLARGPGGIMYVGGSNELGYLTPTSAGTLRYESLLPHLPDAQRTFQDVWTVQAIGESVYFYTYRQLMRWTPATGSMTVWQFEHDTVLVEGTSTPVLQNMRDGTLQRLSGDVWQPFAQAEVLRTEPVRLIVPQTSDDSLLVTGRALYRLRHSTLHRQASVLDRGDRRQWVYDAVPLPGGYLALGTLYDGVLFVGPDGALVRKYAKEQGLPDNAVLALGYDGEGHLWICLERGLVRADVGSGVTYIGGREGLAAQAVAMAEHEGKLYVGGVGQLAQIDATPHAPMHSVASFPDDVLNLLSTPQGLFVGMTGALRIYREGQLEPVPGFNIDGDYPTALLRSTVDTTRLYVGYRRGLAVLRLQGGRWAFERTVEGVEAHVTSLAERADGTLWMGTQHEDAWRLSPSGVVTRFGPKEGLPRIIVAPLRVGDDLVFYSSQGFYRLQGNRIVRDTSPLAAALGKGEHNITDARAMPGGDVHLVVDGEVGMLRRTGEAYRWEPLEDRMVQRTTPTAGWRFGDALWLTRTNMLVRTQAGARPDSTFGVYIEEIRTVQGDSLIHGGFSEAPDLKLPTRSSLTFTASTPRYDGAQFRFWLEGAEAQWSDWTDDRSRTYLALSAGNYTLHIQARDRFGNVSSEAVSSLRIVPAWYWSRGMLIVYVVFALLLVLGCVAGAARWQERRSEAARRLLKAKVRVHTREAEAQKRMLRYLNKTLQESNAQLEEMSAQKSRLLSIAAHDLKTPIANIYSLAEILLEERNEGPPNYEFLELIRTSAKQLSTLIDDVLNSEARETGQLRVRPVRTDLRMLAKRAVQQCIGEAERKGQTIRLHAVPQGGAFETEVDELRIVEAMTNLVGNAVKYSRLGASIEVHVTRTVGAFRFEVRDQGPGIRDEERNGLFQPFQRLSAQPTGGESSSGMGLYIVRQYIELHEGEVGVESLPSVGSIFWFTLPAPDETEATPAATRAGAESKNPA